MQTFRALVNIPKQQLKGSTNPEPRSGVVAKASEPMGQPLFVTEHACRVALLDGTLARLGMNFDKAIADVHRWAAYLKALDKPRFRKQAAIPNHSRYTHRMQF